MPHSVYMRSFHKPHAWQCFLAIAMAFCMCSSGSRSAAAHTAAAPQRQTSTPYTGDLSVFEYRDRDKKLQIGRVMDLLGIKPGAHVADLGAGSGWFTVRAAPRVAPGGAVYAEDINPVAVKEIAERARQMGLRDVHTVQGSADDPKLPRGSVDAVLMMKMYHEIARPEAFLSNLKPALRAGAKVGIIDRNGNGADHGVNESVVVKEMGEAGFERVGRYDFTKADGQDYFLIFMQRR